MKDLSEQAKRYTYRVWWSDSDESFVCDVVELDGVLAHGESPDRALEVAQDLARIVLEDAVEHGAPIPRPAGDVQWLQRQLRSIPADSIDADYLRVIRRNLALTQQAFAELLGVSLNTVQAWEQGVNVPGAASQRLIRLIEVLASSPTDLSRRKATVAQP